MPFNSDRRLYQPTELPDILQLSEEQIQFLVDTRQLTLIRIAGEDRFDARDIDQLISSYKTTASRRIQ
jgi:hypothetical protein